MSSKLRGGPGFDHKKTSWSPLVFAATMPKKGGKKGGKKKKSSAEEGPPVPEYGPMGCDGTIDAIKGGTITATRLGRTYSLVVPPGAVEASVSVSMRVTQFEGGEPGNFGLEGRIVSNRVEISPPLLDLNVPAILSIPHFCAGEPSARRRSCAGLLLGLCRAIASTPLQRFAIRCVRCAILCESDSRMWKSGREFWKLFVMGQR